MTAAPAIAGNVAVPLWLAAAPAVFVLLWSGGYAAAKVGLAHAEPFSFLALRYILAFLLLLPIAAVMRPALPREPREWWHLLVSGFLIQGCYFGLSYFGFWLGVSAGAIALIVSLQPILVGLLAPAAVGERVGRAQWIGLMLGLAGAVMVIWARSAVEATSMIGVGCAVGALFSMTTATLLEKRANVHAHPVVANLVQYGVGVAVVTPCALLLEQVAIEWTPDFLASLAYLVIGNSLIAITLLLAMLRRGEASRVSALLFLVPPIAAFIAWIVVDEAMPPLAWAGFAVAATGVLMATRQAKVKPVRSRPSRGRRSPR
jgi:drug/metabolite transporter (DMT)-like permease